jgi:hypothetical protein
VHDRSPDRTPAPDRAASHPASVPPGPRRDREAPILELQRTHGNRFVQRAVAAYADGGEVPGALEQRIDRARGQGSPLERGVRGDMESAFGVDFGAVRVHTGSEADSLNRSVSARAFTTGSDVFFSGGQYAPGSTSGRELLAHELTHVVQQAGGVRAKLEVSAPGDAYEREADAVARAVAQRDTAVAEERP